MPTTLPVGQVTHVRAADDRRHVVFAMALELDVAQHDEFVVALDFLEGARQVLLGIQRVAAEPVLVGLDHALGRVEQAFARGVLAGPAQQRAHGLFGLGAGNIVAGVAHRGRPWRACGGRHGTGCGGSGCRRASRQAAACARPCRGLRRANAMHARPRAALRARPAASRNARWTPRRPAGSTRPARKDCSPYCS